MLLFFMLLFLINNVIIKCLWGSQRKNCARETTRLSPENDTDRNGLKIFITNLLAKVFLSSTELVKFE